MFTKRQEAELITSLQWRWEIPLKFAYLWDWSKNWENIAKKRWWWWINLIEKNLLSKRIQDFLKSFDNKTKINVIDLGCWDWLPILPVLEELKKQNIKFRYIPLDISQDLLDTAEKNIGSQYDCEIKQILFDFELWNFSEITYDLKEDWYSNFLCFLWSTIWNFSDKNRVLSNMRDSMWIDDFLLIGVEMTNFSKVNKLLSHYQWNLVEDFLYFIPNIINIDKKLTEYKSIWNDNKNQVEVWISLDKDQKIKIWKDSFTMEKWDQILLARSTKFNEWTLTKLLSDSWFRTEILTTTSDRWYVLSLLQPTRYSV